MTSNIYTYVHHIFNSVSPAFGTPVNLGPCSNGPGFSSIHPVFPSVPVMMIQRMLRYVIRLRAIIITFFTWGVYFKMNKAPEICIRCL